MKLKKKKVCEEVKKKKKRNEISCQFSFSPGNLSNYQYIHTIEPDILIKKNILPFPIMSVSDPSNYSSRQVLLLAQLLHSSSISSLKKLKATNENKLQSIIQQWKLHKINGLDGATLNNTDTTIKLNTNNQLIELYGKLLRKYEASNTEELADAAYFKRIEELEDIIDKDKQLFTNILQK